MTKKIFIMSGEGLTIIFNHCLSSELLVLHPDSFTVLTVFILDTDVCSFPIFHLQMIFIIRIINLAYAILFYIFCKI